MNIRFYSLPQFSDLVDRKEEFMHKNGKEIEYTSDDSRIGE
jgi:hypothetical protein